MENIPFEKIHPACRAGWPNAGAQDAEWYGLTDLVGLPSQIPESERSTVLTVADPYQRFVRWLWDRWRTLFEAEPLPAVLVRRFRHARKLARKGRARQLELALEELREAARLVAVRVDEQSIVEIRRDCLRYQRTECLRAAAHFARRGDVSRVETAIEAARKLGERLREPVDAETIRRLLARVDREAERLS